jgi:hypothetical protein
MTLPMPTERPGDDSRDGEVGGRSDRLLVSACRRHRRSDAAALITRCQSRLHFLGMGSVDISGVKEHLERSSGRPIHLVPMTLKSSEPCGMCISGACEDFIVFNASASPLHQDHIIAHELAHIIMGHITSRRLDRATAELLFPDLEAAAVGDLFTRVGSYCDPDEAEAETLASIIQSRSHRQSLPRSPGMLGQLEVAFGNYLGD